jgi:hypothetical protein
LIAEGRRWRLPTLRERLADYARHPIPEMLAFDGFRCGPFTRGVLRRRPIRDGERWLILKEAAVWGDDFRPAFTVPEPEKVRAGRQRIRLYFRWSSSWLRPLLVSNASSVRYILVEAKNRPARKLRSPT